MTEQVYQEIGARIRLARHCKGWSQEELAWKVGVSRPSIVNIEAGRQRLSLHLMIDIASCLGVEPAVLLQASVNSDESYAGRALAAEARVVELEEHIGRVFNRVVQAFQQGEITDV